MFKKKLIVFLALLLISNICFAQLEKPKPADDILKTALQESKTSNKNVFLIFHASWCGWCKRLDKAMN